MRSLCRPLKMLRKLSLLSSSVSVSRVTFCTLASTHLICFALKSWANSTHCFKISSLDWKSVESCSFKAFTTLFSYPSILWCCVREELHPSLRNSHALFEQPSAFWSATSWLQKIKLPRSFGSEPILERLVAFAILSHLIVFLQGTNQTAPFSILQTNQGGYINAYQIKQYGMVQNSPKPSHHIATDENRKIRNRRSCL